MTLRLVAALMGWAMIAAPILNCAAALETHRQQTQHSCCRKTAQPENSPCCALNSSAPIQPALIVKGVEDIAAPVATVVVAAPQPPFTFLHRALFSRHIPPRRPAQSPPLRL